MECIGVTHDPIHWGSWVPGSSLMPPVLAVRRGGAEGHGSPFWGVMEVLRSHTAITREIKGTAFPSMALVIIPGTYYPRNGRV